MHTFFEEHAIDFAVITESWLTDGQMLDRDVIDLEHGTGMRIIYKNRPKKTRTARAVGGGVSIIFSKSSCSFRERKIAGSKFEVVAAVGKKAGLNRQIVIFAFYLPPKMTVADLEELRQLLADQVLQLKKSYNDPLFFMGGDINRKDVAPAFENFDDITQMNYEPTRGAACLDVMFGNAANRRTSVWPPLATNDGIESDHRCVLLETTQRQEKNFTWEKKTARKFTSEACKAYGRKLRETDWSEVLGNGNVNDMVKKFETYTGKITDELFPLKTVRKRSNEPPWITDGIRRLARKKRRMYKFEGKSERWFFLQNKMDRLIEKSQTEFIERAEKGGCKAHFRALNMLGTAGNTSEWDVTQIFPDLPRDQVGERVGEYFTAITDLFEPLTPSRASFPTRQPLGNQEVRQFLKDAKKPSSQVEGDLPPPVVRAHYDQMTEPVTMLFNAALKENCWPTAWKKETTVIIPKTSNPTSLAETRNISCTSFLSKVMETVILKDLSSK